MSKIILTSTLFKLISRLMLLACIGVLFGCSKPHDPKAFMKTFDHILTDQYIETPGQGGIYWVSNEQLVLEARVKNDQGASDRAIYQIDVRDGSYLKVVDIPDQGPITYKFCFDGKILHVMRSRGVFTQTNSTHGYKIEIREMKEKKYSNTYSSLRCQFVENPDDGAGYASLRTGDGFIKYQKSRENRRQVYLTNDNGKTIKELIDQPVKSKFSIKGLFFVDTFSSEKNAYFGNSSWDHKDCAELWWLTRGSWTISNKELCVGDWAKGGSRLVHSFKDVLYLEHYAGRRGKSYIISNNQASIVEDEHGRGAAVSPNGCMVAYGEGAISGKSGIRQKLKLFNYCEYQETRT